MSRKISQAINRRLSQTRQPNSKFTRDELVCPATWRATVTQAPWEGAIEKKPWQHRVTAVVPHCNTPDLLKLCVAMLRSQTEPVYIVVVDTGTQDSMLDDVLALRADDLEVHQINCHGGRHSSELVSIAMEAGQACVQTEWMLTVHSDCLVTQQNLVEEWIERCDREMAAAIGYQSIPRSGCDWWQGMLSHTLSLWHMPQIDRIKAGWTIRRLVNNYRHLWESGEETQRADTEVLINEMLKDASLNAIIVGEETTGEIEEDERRIHLRSFTAAALYGKPSERFDELPDIVERVAMLAVERGQGITSETIEALAAIAQGRQRKKFAEDELDLPSEPAAVHDEPTPVPITALESPGERGRTVTFIAPFYEYYPVLIESLLDQRHRDWKLVLYHDGPLVKPEPVVAKLRRVCEPRILQYTTRKRYNDWGHTLRQLGLNIVSKMELGDYVVITNGDNYYAPGFCDIMVNAIEKQPGAVGGYCDMTHNYWQWKPLRSVLHHGNIDCGCVMVQREVAIEAGWLDKAKDADWTYIERIIERYGEENLVHVQNTLFTHN